MPPAEAGSGGEKNGLDAGLKASSTRTLRAIDFSAATEAAPLQTSSQRFSLWRRVGRARPDGVALAGHLELGEDGEGLVEFLLLGSAVAFRGRITSILEGARL